MNNFTKRAQEIIQKIPYITIATSDGNQPWNSPVASTYDEKYNFYWASWTENQHSKNIRRNPNIFLVIYDSTSPEGSGEGVYIKASAQELATKEEIAEANRLAKNTVAENPEEFLGKYPRRIYKAIPEKFWINGDGDIDGNFIDIRTEVDLLNNE